MPFDRDNDDVIDNYHDLTTDRALLLPAFAEALEEIEDVLGEDE